MSLSFSKSKYCGLWQCPKIAWLRKYKPDEITVDDKLQERLTNGNIVGDLAMGLFGDFVEVTAYDGEKIDLSKMIENTKAEMAKGTPVICEASFDFNGLYCAVDVLKKDGDGWAIYEVKSSTHEDKQIYAADVAYQKYVLESCGVNVTGTYLICINNEYVFDGTLDIHLLFKIADISEGVFFESANIRTNLNIAELILKSEDEPPVDLSTACNNPYRCGFWNYCSRHIPSPSVFDLYGTALHFDKKINFYKQGKIKYEDLITDKRIKNPKLIRQMSYYLEDKGTYVDKSGIREFLSTLSYPLYFLDFETVQPIIPEYIGTKPYSQIPFQYSLHYIEKEGGELKHKEFLAESGTDPRRSLAERLCEDIPMNVCVTAYNKDFECSRIKELAEAFPVLADHLLNIERNIKDLLVPFRGGYYYNKDMGGSFSIKSVLPAIFPNDPELNYKNLEQIHNGGEAMSIFPKIKDMPKDEQETTRKNLLKYCELDTYAMVKIWEELKRVVE